LRDVEADGLQRDVDVGERGGVGEEIGDRPGMRQGRPLRHVERGAVGGDRARVQGLEPGQSTQRRGLARPGRAGQGDDLARADDQLGQAQGVAGGAGVAYAQARRRKAGPVARGKGRRHIGEHFVHVGDHGGGGGRGVIAGGHLAQGPVDLGRQQDDQQGRRERHMSGGHPQAGRDGEQAHRQGADQVERGRGEEGHPQDAEGGGPVAVGQLLDHGDLPGGSAEGAERGEAAYGVQKMARQAGIGRPALVSSSLRGPTDQGAQQRDQREGGQRDERRGGIHVKDHQQHQRRQDGAEDHRRQVTGEPRPQRVEAAGQQRGQAAGSETGHPRRAAAGHGPDQGTAQLIADGRGRTVGDHLLGPGERRPHSERPGQQDDSCRPCGAEDVRAGQENRQR